MKIDIIDENKILVFLSKNFTCNMNFDDKDLAEESFRNLFLRLNQYYGIETVGYYEVFVYNDKYYGVILEIIKEDLEYIEYFENQIDMRITFSKYKDILYEIDDVFNIDNVILAKCLIYCYHDRFYLKIKNDLAFYEMGKIMEYANIIYGKKADNIIKQGKITNLWLLSAVN